MTWYLEGVGLRHVGGALINGISAIINKAPESSSTPPRPSRATPGSGPSPDTESAGTLTLDFQPPELLFKSSSLWRFIIAAQRLIQILVLGAAVLYT